jgi:hypothetical protein
MNKRAVVVALLWVIGLAAVAGGAIAARWLVNDGHGQGEPAANAIPLAVLGDSDSTGYQNTVDYNARALPRQQWVGGEFHAITLQWHEVLARLRGDTLDLGPHGAWGVPRHQSLSRVRRALGQAWRGPHKQDHRHSFAWPSSCNSLMTEPWAQARQLRDLMDRAPAAWQRGVVVIRTGVNDFGKEETLEALAKDPKDAASLRLMDDCAAQYRAAVSHLRERHPQLRFVLVGIFNNAHWPPLHARWQSALEQSNIVAGLRHFDDALRGMAQADARIAFFDDQAWFQQRWGGRDEQGKPAYRVPLLAPSLAVANTAGDAPTNAVLGNQHAGLAWNVWWAQALLALLRERWSVDVKPITDSEAAAFADKLMRSR